MKRLFPSKTGNKIVKGERKKILRDLRGVCCLGVEDERIKGVADEWLDVSPACLFICLLYFASVSSSVFLHPPHPPKPRPSSPEPWLSKEDESIRAQGNEASFAHSLKDPIKRLLVFKFV